MFVCLLQVVRGDLEGVTGTVVAVQQSEAGEGGATFTLRPSAEAARELGITDHLELHVSRRRGR